MKYLLRLHDKVVAGSAAGLKLGNGENKRFAKVLVFAHRCLRNAGRIRWWNFVSKLIN